MTSFLIRGTERRESPIPISRPWQTWQVFRSRTHSPASAEACLPWGKIHFRLHNTNRTNKATCIFYHHWSISCRIPDMITSTVLYQGEWSYPFYVQYVQPSDPERLLTILHAKWVNQWLSVTDNITGILRCVERNLETIAKTTITTMISQSPNGRTQNSGQVQTLRSNTWNF